MKKRMLIVADGIKVSIVLSNLEKKGFLDSSQVFIHEDLLSEMNNDFDELSPEKYNSTFYYQRDDKKTVGITISNTSNTPWHIVSNINFSDQNNAVDKDISYSDSPAIKYYLSKE